MSKAIFAMVLLVAACSLAFADTSGSATATIVATVNPNVAVKAQTPIVDAGTVQMGDFSATIDFRVDANKESVALAVEASQLYKGDDPANKEVAPIPLNLTKGVEIAPTNANPVSGGSNVASFVGEGSPVGAYPTMATKAILFESSQNNRFSQDVFVKVTWTQDDPEKPMGQYSGKVRFTAFLMP